MRKVIRIGDALHIKVQAGVLAKKARVGLWVALFGCRGHPQLRWCLVSGQLMQARSKE